MQNIRILKSDCDENAIKSRTTDAYSSGHLVLSHLGLAFVLMLRPFFPELVISTDLLSLEYPSVLLFYIAIKYGCLKSMNNYMYYLQIINNQKVVISFLLP